MTLYTGGYDAFETPARRARRAARGRAGGAGCAARAAAGLYRAQQRPRLDRQAGAVARQDAGQDAADRRDGRGSEPELRLSRARRAAPAADHARHGRGRLCRGKPVLRRLNLRLDPDDRIALLGRNGNGKTTLARLLAAQLRADGRRDERVGQDAGRLFHPVSGRGAARRRHAARAYDPRDGAAHARRGARAARPVRLLRATRRRRRSASCRAASGRGWRWR